MNASAGEPTRLGLGELSRSFARMEKQFDELRTHVDKRFDHLDGKVATLTYVPKDLYEEKRAADRAYAEETRAIALAARSTSMAVLMTLAGLIISAGIGIFLAVTA